MPESRESPDNQKIDGPSAITFSVAAKRNIHIIPEKRTEGDMPPGPEIFNRTCDIGIIKVFRK